MSLRIEDYALIGNCETAALVGRDGSVDWFSSPRFDSPACFAALLGTAEQGRFAIAPNGPVEAVERRYRSDTLVVETDFRTSSGVVRIIDFMPLGTGCTSIVRIVEGVAGHVPMRLELVIRFDYGSVVPWVRRDGNGISAVAGPDVLYLDSDVPCRGENLRTVAEFDVTQGDRRHFVVSSCSSIAPKPAALDAEAALRDATRFWTEWSRRSTYQGRYRDAVTRSLITLKALGYGPTGGLVAAATTSLPEKIGSVRNWDYRFCWLRDATFSLYALLIGGYQEEARAWRQWLLRAIAGDPSQIQIMYGLAGERRLPELELGWLPGYEGSVPVRVGNAAADQRQLDVYGEVMDSLYLARRHGIEASGDAWSLQRKLMEFLEAHWMNPDAGIWEIRGPEQQFTHSKMMAWVAADRAVKCIQRFGESGPLDRWSALRDTIHRDVCAHGFDAKKLSFVQAYGSNHLDASLLMMPLVGFLPSSDPRVKSTVAAIERELVHDGLVYRYATETGVDGLAAGEGAFLTCTFWLADNLVRLGRRDEATEIFERLIALGNDVGLIAEQYDPVGKRQLGNFPQAFSHVALINTAHNLSTPEGPAIDVGRRGQ
jgi:GH15 family glucan-1,4-alpha-glucosidase